MLPKEHEGFADYYKYESEFRETLLKIQHEFLEISSKAMADPNIDIKKAKTEALEKANKAEEKFKSQLQKIFF